MRLAAVAACATLALLTVLLGSARPARAAQPDAVAVVEALHAGMLGVIRDAERSSFDERAARLGPILDGAFDLDFMARKSLGRSFDALDGAQQKQWTELFRRFMVANYAGRLERDTGQRFEMLGEEPAAQGTVLVRTRVVDPGGENVDLSYRLRQTPAGWRIIDVYLKNRVSELALRRSDFTALLGREGFPALVASVEQKIADLRAGKAGKVS